MTVGGLGQFNVVAAYPDLKHARSAIDALQFHGIDAGRISLLGENARHASDAADHRTQTTDTEGPMAWRMVRRAALCGGLGTLIGAAVGAVIFGFGAAFPSVGDNAAVQLGSWTLFGLIAGAVWGFFSAITTGDEWELTFEQDSGERVIVGVHSQNPAEILRAEKILREKEALSVSQVDRRGEPVA